MILRAGNLNIMKPIALLFFTGLVHWSLQSVAAGPVLQIQPGANDTSILRDGRLAFVYRSDATLYKPYVALLTTPSGLNILRDAPADHAHHHGLMFALTANDVDFWGEKVALAQENKCGPVSLNTRDAETSVFPLTRCGKLCNGRTRLMGRFW